jgi:transmembrane sensor
MAMTEHGDNGPAQSVSDQAAEWFIRLRDRDLTAAERRKYVRWLKQSPSHISEFMRLCQLYGRVKRAKIPSSGSTEQDTSNVIALMQREMVAPPERQRFEPQNFRLVAAVCSFALICVIGVIAKIAFFSNTIETQANEWRQLKLADGSTVNVGPRTLLHVDFSKERRGVHLQRGEAMFQVIKDPSRPFIVNADTAAVRAVGTKFAVDRRDDSVVVTVAEGKVAVVRGSQLAALESAIGTIDKNMTTSLVADERVQISARTPSLPLQVEKVDSRRALAWAQGQLIFQSVTLGEAVREFNRRNRIQIQVDDPKVAAWHVCCVFDAADPERFAEDMALQPDIALVRDGSNVLRLVPETPGAGEPGGNAI